MSFHPELFSLLDQLSGISDKDVAGEVRKAEQAVLAEQTKRGMFRSNGTLFKVRDAIEALVDERQATLLSSLDKALQARPLVHRDASAVVELQKALMADMQRYYAHGASSVAKVAQITGYSNGTNTSFDDLAKKRETRLLGEIEILLARLSLGTSKRASIPSASNRVFVVHGRNEDVREAVCSEIRALGLQPVVLHEQPNRGRTIIEKFEDYSDVSFAVVLLTGDDKGCLATEDKPQLRARQNVLLEMGFFLGRLGRERVLALYQNGVDLPSDYDGVLFVALDPGDTWQAGLRRELADLGMIKINPP